MKRTIILSMLVCLSSCGAPIANAEEPASSNPALDPKPQASLQGENLLKAYGCPNQFADIPLCAQIFWFDDQGKAANGPINWQRYPQPAMSAKLFFWSSKDGWPIDPRLEFPEAKVLKIKLYMPTMCHGTMGAFPVVEEIKGRIGQFQVTNLRFVMPSSERDPWHFRIQLKSEHEDSDFDNADEPSKEPHVWKQKIIQFTSVERR